MLKMICNECKSKFGQVYESNDVEVEDSNDRFETR